ncbi:MAG TPA: hypothetical protein VIM67_10890 [Terriglobus sp.]
MAEDDIEMGKGRSYVMPNRTAEIVAALMWGPKKDAELMEILGVNHVMLSKCTHALKASGVIYRKSAIRVPGQSGRPQKPWAIQSKPFACEDEP